MANGYVNSKCLPHMGIGSLLSQRLSDYCEQGRALKCDSKTHLSGEAWKEFGNVLTRGFGTFDSGVTWKKGLQQLKDKLYYAAWVFWKGLWCCEWRERLINRAGFTQRHLKCLHVSEEVPPGTIIGSPLSNPFWEIHMLGCLSEVFVHWHSLGNDLDELEISMWVRGCDLIEVMETPWDASHDWSAAMQSYRLFRKDRLGRWEGGVVFYLRK